VHILYYHFLLYALLDTYQHLCLRLHRVDINEKLQLTAQAWQLYQQGELQFGAISKPHDIKQVCFPEKPELLAPKYMARLLLYALLDTYQHLCLH
jgi:uncharacterized ferritin-like protein (DUF455 family)